MSSLLKVEAGYYRCDWQGDLNVTIMTAKLECNKRLKDSVHDALILRNRIGWLYMEHVLALFLGHLFAISQKTCVRWFSPVNIKDLTQGYSNIARTEIS